MYKCLFVALALAIPASAFGFASDNKPLDTRNAFIEQRTKIDANLADGKTYSEISRKDRLTVEEALDRIEENLESGNDLDALGETKKALVLQDEELVNGILSKASEDSRLICTREKKIGSNRSTSQCATAAQRRRNAEQSQDTLRGDQSGMAPSAN